MRPLRNHLRAAGIPVENTKGEAETGQQELNIRYADAMLAAEHHSIAKHAAKEIGWQQGMPSRSFLNGTMTRWDPPRISTSRCGRMASRPSLMIPTRWACRR